MFSLSFLGTGVWAVIRAALFLVVAFVVSAIVKSLVVKLISKGKVGEFLGKIKMGDGKTDAKVLIGKLVYLLVFLLFIPSIFSSLGMSAVTSPITNLLNVVWSYVPNVAAAAIILVIGFFVAKLVRQILVPVFDKLNINKLQEKAGIEVTDSAKLSYTLAYVVYVLILIPTIVMALDVLDIRVISNPAMNMLNMIFASVPNILVALIIIVIGCFIGKFVGQIVTKLIATAGLDAKLAKLMDNDAQKVSLSKLAGVIVQVVVIVFFVVEGINVLNLNVLTSIGGNVISYMPAVLGAVLIMAIAFFASSAAEKALKKSGCSACALMAKVAILTVAAFMVLSQLGIAAEIVNTAFTLLLAALAIAFAIAFGIGGKEFAFKTLKKFEDSLNKKDEQ